MEKPEVSVIMPAYCCERFIADAIESVLNQTYQNFELLVIDDCSYDSTAEIVKKYVNKDSRVVYLRNEQNMGVAKTRNRGIAESNGRYIALLDSDDVWEREKLERQLALMKATDAEIGYCSYGFIDAENQRIKKPFVVPPQTDFQHMLVCSVISCSTALIKSELLKAHPFRPEIYHEDYALWMELLSLPVIAVGNEEVLMHYRQVAGSRNEKKLHAAIERWKIYRKTLKLGVLKSIGSFCQYAVRGIVKYWL